MFRVVICDDDKEYIDRLKELIEKSKDKDIRIQYCEFYSGEELLNKDIYLTADVIFLDIQMKGLSGNQVAYRLNERGYKGVLVQCSAYFAPSTETVVIAPYRYLQKGDPKEKNTAVVKEILKEMMRRHELGTIDVELGRQLVSVDIRSIVYIRRDRKGSIVVLDKQHIYAGETLICRKKLDELIGCLREADFAFPHNGYVVNLNYLERISLKDNTIVLGGEIFNISRSKKDEFIRDVACYSNSKYSRG